MISNGTATDVRLSDQWRKALAERQARTDVPVLVALPSGLSVKATRPNLLLLLRTGRIPDALAGRVEQLIQTAQSGGEDAVRVALTADHQTNPAATHAMWANLLDTVWLAAVVEPAFGPALSTDPDLIPVDQVAEDDKNFLFMWCQGVTEDVATFLGRQQRPAAPVGTGPTGGPLRSGSGAPAGGGFEA
jgi:hypothetical protein